VIFCKRRIIHIYRNCIGGFPLLGETYFKLNSELFFQAGLNFRYMILEFLLVFGRNREMEANGIALAQSVFCSFHKMLVCRSPAFSFVTVKFQQSLGKFAISQSFGMK